MKPVQLPSYKKRRGTRISKKFVKFASIIGVLVIALFLVSFFKAPGESFRFIFQSGGLRSSDGKVNILLLGNAGGTHDGAQLTDTIMVASYNLKTNNIYLISLPRDMWSETAKGKINSVYEIGENKSKGGGLILAKQVIGDIVGVPLNYAVRVDFGGFTKAVDLLGGIDVNVENSFEDNLYPIEGRENDLCGLEEKEMDFNAEMAKSLNIPQGKRVVLIAKDGKIATDSAEEDKGIQYFGCRYESISFKSGVTHMDGITALKFVRSRHGTGEEGSDFARSKRQQLVLESFRTKALSLQTLSSPTKVSNLLTTFGHSFETDIPGSDMPSIYSSSKKVNQTHNFVLATTKQELLIHPPTGDFGGAWVLVPKSGNFDEIHNFIAGVLKGDFDVEATASARPSTR